MYDILVERCNMVMKQQQQILNSMVVVATKGMVFYSKKKTKNKESRCAKFLKFYSGTCFSSMIRSNKEIECS